MIYSRVLDLEWNEWYWFLAFNSFAYRFFWFFEIKNRTGSTRFRFWLGFGSVSVFFQKKKKESVWLFFSVQNRTEPKMLTLDKRMPKGLLLFLATIFFLPWGPLVTKRRFFFFVFFPNNYKFWMHFYFFTVDYGFKKKIS